MDEADARQLELFVEATPPGILLYEKEKCGFEIKGESVLDMRTYGQTIAVYRNALMIRQPVITERPAADFRLE